MTAAFAVQVLTRAVPVAAAPLDAPTVAVVAAAPEAPAPAAEASPTPVNQYLVRDHDTRHRRTVE